MNARRLARPSVLLLVGGVTIYLLLPSLLTVFGSWRTLRHLDWRFAALALVCELASFTCRWELDRIALGTRDRFTVVTAQLTANALGRVPKTAVAGLGASTALQVATVLALPRSLSRPSSAGRRPSAAPFLQFQVAPIRVRCACWSAGHGG